MNFQNLTIFQKINYYLVFFMGISIIALIFASGMDFYARYIVNEWDKDYQSKFILVLVVSSLIQLFVIWPNAFTIYVHEMRKQIQPPIPFYFTLTKNIFIGFILALLLIPLFIYPYLKSSNSSDLVNFTKHLINKRHHSISTNYIETVLYTGMAIIFCLPFIGFINWFQAMIWKGIVRLNIWLKGR